jgi:hypothetical protein
MDAPPIRIATQHVVLNIRKPFWLRFLEKIGAGRKADLGGFHAAGALTAPRPDASIDTA